VRASEVSLPRRTLAHVKQRQFRRHRSQGTPACHAGGRGFESRRSRLSVCLVRSVLVPAAMQLLGERNWYLPGWLQWLPHFDVEGQPEQAAGAVAARAPAEVRPGQAR
jgi:hypothetical protein